MAKFIVKSNFNVEVEADNENEAIDKVLTDIDNEPQTTISQKFEDSLNAIFINSLY